MLDEVNKPTALVVEDNEHVAFLLDYMLRREGFVVITANNGRRAAEYVVNEPPPDVVVLDLMLPYKNGFELLDDMRSRPAWTHVPIIMLSARSREEDVIRALDAGATDYVVKPYNPRELLARIKRSLRVASLAEQ